MRESKCKSKSIMEWMLIGLCLFLTACGNSAQEEQLVEEVPEKQLAAETGVLGPSSSANDWVTQYRYIIQSKEELEIFVTNAEADDLNQNDVFPQIDFDTYTLLVNPENNSGDYQYECKEPVIENGLLQLGYSRQGNGYTCDEVTFWLYAIVSNEELSDDYYEGWVKPSDILVSGYVEADTGVIITEKIVQEGPGDRKYIIPSEDELKVFLKGMDDKSLKKEIKDIGWNPERQTLLFIPIQDSKDFQYVSNVVVLKDERLNLRYSIYGDGKSEEKTRYYLYARVSKSVLKNDTYEGWVTPSEVFGE
ncbi:MAG: hypothetical protein II994_03395 [Lachnospiraceae bacterium]|nr:hypothetical protein [Lachnospiraceae bacterium]